MSRRSCVRHAQKSGKNIPNRRGYGESRRQGRRLRQLGRWVRISSALALQMFGNSLERIGLKKGGK